MNYATKIALLAGVMFPASVLAEMVEVTCTYDYYSSNAMGQRVHVEETLRGSGYKYNGYIFTAAHTFLDESGNILCEKSDYPFHTIDAENDVAVLGDPYGFPQLPPHARDARHDEMVSVAGYPLTFGFNEKRRGRVQEEDRKTGMMIALGRADQGMSGGPVMTEDGSFVGVLHGIIYPPTPDQEPFFYFIKTSQIKDSMNSGRGLDLIAQFRANNPQQTRMAQAQPHSQGWKAASQGYQDISAYYQYENVEISYVDTPYITTMMTEPGFNAGNGFAQVDQSYIVQNSPYYVEVSPSYYTREAAPNYTNSSYTFNSLNSASRLPVVYQDISNIYSGTSSTHSHRSYDTGFNASIGRSYEIATVGYYTPSSVYLD